MLRMNLDVNGYITAIGYITTYALAAPWFINVSSPTVVRCANQSDINNPASWVNLPVEIISEIPLP